MRIIYKYPIVSDTGTVVSKLIMQKNAVPLSVGWQDGQGVVLWASVDLNNMDWREYAFDFVPTGMHYDDTGMKFIGTVQTPDGFVGHLFIEGGD